MVSGIACVGVKGMIFDVCIYLILGLLFYHSIIFHKLRALTRHFNLPVSNCVTSSVAFLVFIVIELIFAPSRNRLVIFNVSGDHQLIPGLQDMSIELQELKELGILLLYLQHGVPSTV